MTVNLVVDLHCLVAAAEWRTNFITATSTSRVAVVEKGSISLHEGQGQLLEQVPGRGCLLFPSVVRKGAAQLFNFRNGGLGIS